MSVAFDATDSERREPDLAVALQPPTAFAAPRAVDHPAIDLRLLQLAGNACCPITETPLPCESAENR